MVVPREHGAWGMLLVPLSTGAVVAAQSPINALALALFVIAALGLFWIRTPLEAWMGTSAIKVHTQAERKAVLRVSVVLLILEVAAIAALFGLGYSRGLLLIGTLAALSFVVQAPVKRVGRRGRMPAQIIGAIGLTSTAAGAYYVATGRLNSTAVALWVANWAFAGDQVHFVQLRIRASRASSLGERVRQGRVFLVAQLMLLLAAGLLSWFGFLPRAAWLAFLPAIYRGTAWFFQQPKPLNVHRLGFSELFQAVLFGVLLCASFVV